MAVIRPFQCVRPRKDVADRVAALPYDVYNRQEAKKEVEREPLSFLKIDRAETNFDDSVDTYAPEVYQKAKEILNEEIARGIYEKDDSEAYYIYELTMNGRAQTGLVACASVDDYVNNVIKKHENTREDKEIDRITHVDTCSAQTGPIFLAYRAQDAINKRVEANKEKEPVYDFTAVDGVKHRVWKMSDPEDVEAIRKAFENLNQIYIADGHHRAASAVKVGLKRRKENPAHTGKEDQLMIMDYNRSVTDLNGLTVPEFLEKIKENFEVEKVSGQVRPQEKGTFGMYLEDGWYVLKAKENLYEGKDAVGRLDVAVLQDYLLNPVLGIQDPRTDERIEFIGGIRGLSELEKKVKEGMKVSFSMYPTSITELFDVADQNLLMPPKSTWFEPKLRSGLFIHQI